MTPSIKRGLALLAGFIMIFFLTAGARSDESQKVAPPMASQGQGAQFEPCQGMMGGGMAGPRMGAMPMMRMWSGRQGGMGMPGIMGPMGPGMGMAPMMQPPMMRMIARNPKLAGKMMQMHADIMRAVADVMTKYGKEMESGQWPALQGKGGGGGDDD